MRAAVTELMATTIAPNPSERMMVEGMSSMPMSDTTTVLPEIKMARLAVLPVMATASDTDVPAASSSRNRWTATRA